MLSNAHNGGKNQGYLILSGEILKYLHIIMPCKNQLEFKQRHEQQRFFNKPQPKLD